jgi:hypothetical protein
MEVRWNIITVTLRVVEGDEKGNPVPGGITGPPCHGGDINTETWSSKLVVGRKADDLTLYVIQRSKNRIVCFKTNLAEASKEDYGTKRAVFQMIMMMMMIQILGF